ncbi:MAG TPA: lipoyl(octanoyl) transferase LipB [Actinomycetota bacterium]|nr:lipoyl(octanoyl) transferase LipB [Actinomycetota bacterium]
MSDVVLDAAWLGLVPYADAWARQCAVHDARVAGALPDTLLLLEHPPTYTLGRRALEQDLRFDAAERAARGIELHRATRGGRATYHGPGQLVGYPILSFRARYDVATYCTQLEEALLRTAADLGVAGRRDPEHRGVWVDEAKLASIGVKLSRGVSLHGFAFNVCPDLGMFDGIVPCGIADRGVTSVAAETGVVHDVAAVARRAAGHLAGVLGRTVAWVAADALPGPAAAGSPDDPAGRLRPTGETIATSAR